MPGRADSTTPFCPVISSPGSIPTGCATAASQPSCADRPCTAPAPLIRTSATNVCPADTLAGASTVTSSRVATGCAAMCGADTTPKLIANRIRSSKPM